MSLVEKLKDLTIMLAGNRMTYLAQLGVLDGIHLVTSGEDFGLLLTLHSSCALMNTFCGTTTLSAYRRTEEHIQRLGRLDPRFAKRLILKAWREKHPLYGYCREQGLYLAARNLGHGEAAREALRKYSRTRIPHF